MGFAKKAIVITIAVLAFTAIAAGFAAAAPVEISYMMWYNTTQSEGQTQQAIIDKFNASQNRIKVSLILIPRDGFETKVNTMAAGGQLPDCTTLSEAMAIEFAANDLLADVSTMYPPDAAPLKTCTFTYKGKPVGYSSGNEVLLLYYNKKLFDAAKVSYPPASADKAWTWDQFVQAAKKLTKDKNGKTPNDAGFDAKNIVTFGADFNRLWWMWPIVMYSNGGGLMSPDGKELWINKPESIEAMQKLADLYVKDKVAPSVGDKNAMPSLDLTLLTNKIAMATSGQWEMGVSLNNSLKDGLDYGVGVLPKMKKAVTYNTGAPYGVFKATKHLAEAIEFIRYISSEEISWEQITNGILMPVNAKWYKNEAAMRQWADHPPRPAFAMYKTAVIDYAMNNAVQVPWYYFNGYMGLNDIIESGTEAVWNGKTTAKDYINSIMPKLTQYFNAHKN
jgi:multiple sugar transport system substrate-binding protein